MLLGIATTIGTVTAIAFPTSLIGLTAAEREVIEVLFGPQQICLDEWIEDIAF